MTEWVFMELSAQTAPYLMQQPFYPYFYLQQHVNILESVLPYQLLNTFLFLLNRRGNVTGGSYFVNSEVISLLKIQLAMVAQLTICVRRNLSHSITTICW